jgi:glycosyltransferase involved in cell wall biosynthesis
MTRILYECLDKDIAAGGVRRLYRHVEILTKHGFDAYVLHHEPKFRMTWFDSDAPVCYWDANFNMTPHDILVIPERHSSVMRQTIGAKCKRVIISLNWANIFAALPEGDNWNSYQIKDVIAGGIYERDFIFATMGISSSIIHQGIDTNLFKPSTDKKIVITYMSAKQARYTQVINGIFRATYPDFSYIPFLPIENISHAEVADALSRSAIFLAQSFPEGVSRKALEAMASGCLVVGFAGHGSLEFMHHLENCYLAPDGDALLAARFLGIAVESFLNGSSHRMSQAARATALRYSPDLEEISVVKYWTDYLSRESA